MVKQFCPKGHDTYIVGRTSQNYCKECKKEYRITHKVEIKKYMKTYRNKNKKHIKIVTAKYAKEHRSQIRVFMRKYLQEKLTNDVGFKLRSQLRNRINRAIKYNYKAGSAVRDLGCSVEFFKTYLEPKFLSNMSWDNWGKVWELDHIKPLWKFDLENSIQFKQAVHYTNLQPLPTKEHEQKTSNEASERVLI